MSLDIRTKVKSLKSAIKYESTNVIYDSVIIKSYGLNPKPHNHVIKYKSTPIDLCLQNMMADAHGTDYDAKEYPEYDLLYNEIVNKEKTGYEATGWDYVLTTGDVFIETCDKNLPHKYTALTLREIIKILSPMSERYPACGCSPSHYFVIEMIKNETTNNWDLHIKFDTNVDWL